MLYPINKIYAHIIYKANIYKPLLHLKWKFIIYSACDYLLIGQCLYFLNIYEFPSQSVICLGTSARCEMFTNKIIKIIEFKEKKEECVE